MTKHGINPVTIRPLAGRGNCCLTIGRLHILREQGPDRILKIVTVAMWDPSNLENHGPAAIELSAYDEDIFIQALGHLFPHGELDGANLKEE
jgi:hypothetical protein